MRRLHRRTLLLALLALLGAAHAASGRQAATRLPWREFTSEAGGFSVKFPGTPRVTHPVMNKGPLNIPRNLHEVAVGGDYRFELDYMDMPAGLEPELALEGGISGLTNPMLARGGRVLTNGKVTRGACEGREATLSVQVLPGKSGFVQGRIFYSGQRYYMLVFVAAEDRPAAREVGRTFLDSLVIKDGCSAAVAPTVAPSSEVARSTVDGTPDAATGWRRIESAEHGFSVLMPGAARRESSQAQVQPFPVFHHEYVSETDEAIYTAEVLGDYPQGFYNTATSFENQLDINIYAAKRNLTQLGLTFAAPRKLKVGIYPGREYVVSNEQAGLRGRVQVYATPRRAYIFIGFTRGKGPAAAAEIERFFSSIRVSPK